MGEHEKFLAEVNAPEAKKFAVVREVDRPIRYVVVGFTTKVIDNVEQYLPAPELGKPTTAVPDHVGESDYEDRRKQRFLAEAEHCLHLRTFQSVFLSCPGVEGVTRFNAEGRGPGKLPPVCKAVRSWLMESLPHAWSPRDKWPPLKVPPEVVFVGFGPQAFLDQLGLECSLPENGSPLPVSLWRNSDTIDLERLSEPLCSLPMLFRRRMPLNPKAIEVWTKLLDGWDETGKDAMKDHNLALELAAQLGFLVS